MVDILSDFLHVSYINSSDLFFLTFFGFSLFVTVFVGIISRILK